MKFTVFFTKNYPVKLLILLSFSLPFSLNAQDKAIRPSAIITGTYHGETPPLRDLPALSAAEWQAMAEEAERKVLNPKLRTRSFPYAATALPKGPDPVWQKEMAAIRELRAPVLNFNGQDSPYFPPDANGTVGPDHYMQTINLVYAIYDKSGTLVAGPAPLNTLFTGVPGSNCNNGDPIVLFDEQADRWLVAEFSLCGPTDYMLIAVSTTNDPTGTWHKYSFDVDDTPDYEKFGIWQDGYYMGTNNSSGNDIYVFNRAQMLAGQTAQGVGFNNPWRPTTIDGFMCVPPLDNDGAFAPEGEPGLFITINDDAIGGGADQLWIYELDVDWSTPANSTFTRTQQLNVAAFDSNFGGTWDNIKQLGTAQELDGIPQVIMNPPQYRNFGDYETIVCCHTVDVDDTDHAGIRWYELRRVSGGDWIIRQQGTYAPDEHSRWMGSIMLNGHQQIALGYSISSTSLNPGIRYCGQSASAYISGNSTMDIAEEIIQAGAFSQTLYNRWGDYSAMQVDPSNDSTFWYTTHYVGDGIRKTKIASFDIPIGPGVWIGGTSGNWTDPANWSYGSLPTSAMQVTIPSSAENWPVYTGDLSIGTTSGNVYLFPGAQMTVTGSLIIGDGSNLTFSGDGELSVGGDWTASGTFVPGEGTIIFTGNSASSISATVDNSGISSITLSTFTKNMTALSGGTPGPTGNDAYLDPPIGFEFNYLGVDYDSLSICTNGWVSLIRSGTNNPANASLFTTSIPRTTLGPWFDNLAADASGLITYKTEGTAPFREFTTEWNNVLTYRNNATARISFQVKLFETTNIIEFHYGNLMAGTHSPNETASIAIKDAIGGVNHFIEATTGSMTTGINSLRSDLNWPAVNYRFTPPVAIASFNNIIISKTNSTVEFNSNTVINGSFSVSPDASFTVKNGRTLNVNGTVVE
jgi:hypothetical protein